MEDDKKTFPLKSVSKSKEISKLIHEDLYGSMQTTIPENRMELQKKKKNRSLMEIAKCFLIDVGLEKKYWGKSVHFISRDVKFTDSMDILPLRKRRPNKDNLLKIKFTNKAPVNIEVNGEDTEENENIREKNIEDDIRESGKGNEGEDHRTNQRKVKDLA
ncbi:hypothetical protein V1478_005091 [Vespula squamosa]|uniref:Uncharacterized protein n=1 Tax=Vespula squamosa TaxID=30214 RepID=A0ABD2BD45_VESSQ